jgi:hypothetical protein
VFIYLLDRSILEEIRQKERHPHEEDTKTQDHIKLTTRWWVRRVIGIMFFLFGILLLTWFIIMQFLSQPPSVAIQIASAVIGAIVVICVILLLLRPISKETQIPRADEEDSYDAWLVAIGVSTCVFWIRFLIPVPDIVQFVAFLIAIVVGIGLLVKCLSFRWRNYLIVGIAWASFIFIIVYPASLAIENDIRIESLRPVVSQCTSLCTSEDIKNAFMQHRLGKVIHIEGPFLVLDAVESKSSKQVTFLISPLEQYLPRGLLAYTPETLKTVVVVGPLMTNSFIPDPKAKLVAPVLFYSWPDKEFIDSDVIDTGCFSFEAENQVLHGMVEALITKLDYPAVSISK